MKNVVAILLGIPLYLLSLLPLRVLYLFSSVFFFLLYYLLGYRKRVVRMNMYACFPDTTSVQIYRWQKEFYHYLSRLVVEIIKGISAKKTFFEDRMTVDNAWLSILGGHYNQGRHILILTGHYGNWEWSAARLSAIERYTKYVLYRTQNGPADVWMKWLRRKGDLLLLPEKNIRDLFVSAAEKPCLAVMAADQTPVHVKHSQWVKFLGLETPFHPGPERVAKRMNAIVYYAAVEPTGKGQYHIAFTLLTDAPNTLENGAITKLYAKSLEDTIKKAPSSWLWSHRRWKRADIPGLD